MRANVENYLPTGYWSNCRKRRQNGKPLRKLCQDLCDKRDGAMLPDKDIGESHLFIRLE